MSRRILIDPVRWRGTTGPAQPAPALEAFQQAVFTDQRLRLRYRRGRDGLVHTYTLDPYGLVNKAGVWYLVADHKGQPRLFRADRAQAAVALGAPVQRRAGLELADVWDTLRRDIEEVPAPLTVTVRVHKRSVAMFLRIHQTDLADPPPEREPDDDRDWTQIRLRFRALLGTQPLLAFGPDVEVLTPETVRQHLADTAQSTVAMYNTSST